MTEAPSTPRSRARTPLLAVLTAILVLAALKLAEPVFLPLVLAIFTILLAWPLQAWLQERVPRWLATLLTVLVVVAGASIILGAMAYSAAQIAQKAPQLQEQAQQLEERAREWAAERGVAWPDSAAAQLQEFLPSTSTVGSAIYRSMVILGLALAFLLLGILEVPEFRIKVDRRLRSHLGDEVIATTAEIAHRVRRFLLALTITSAISGLVTGLYLWALGVELALTWGLVTFLLNYIHTIGPTLAVIPPTIYALLQFDGLTQPLLVFFGVGAIQFTVGNFIDPKIEGKVLSLSPVFLLFSIVLWGWLWGALGALLAVPLTAAMLVVARQFRSTRWISALLAGVRAGDTDES